MHTTSFQPAAISGLTIPPGARGVLVTAEGGGFRELPVFPGDSVLNIRRDLMKHMNECPYASEFLEELRDYCNARLQARSDAQATGCIAMPGAGRNEWRML